MKFPPIVRLLCLSLIFALPIGTALKAQDIGQVGLPKTLEPQVVGAGGEFTHRVPISIPAFRDLPLDVSLTYNSSNTTRSDIDYTVAFGWRLSAASVIERRSLGGGVPTFDDGQDLYLLDGQELMACGDTGATNPWALRYPLLYVTDRPNASCSAGGNFSPRIETQQRVAYIAASNRFIVTQPNGVQYVYVSIGELIGDTSVAGSAEENYARKARWLLREIRDTQVTPNVVQYTYWFAGKTLGYAHRLVRIDYADYSVRFDYQYRPTDNGGRFATGTPLMGHQPFRLSAISVFDETSPIRAYQLWTTSSSLTQTTLLTRVAEYGSNFVLTNGIVTDGSLLPYEEFTYSPDQASFQTQTYPGREFHEAVTVLDTNYDGTDELVFAPEALVGESRTSNNTWYHAYHTFSEGHYRFTRTRSIVNLPALPQRCRATFNGFSYPPNLLRRWREPVDVAGNNRGTSPLVCLRHAYRYFETGTSDNSNVEDILSTLNMSSGSTTVLGSRATSTWGSSSISPQSWRANFDLDPDSEVIIGGQLFDIVDGVFSAGLTAPRAWRAPPADGVPQYTTDFTGDGVDDVFSSVLSRVVAERGFLAGTVQDRGAYTNLTVPSGNRPPVPVNWVSWSPVYDDFLGYGDIDGNGLTDLVFHRANGTAADSIVGYLSTGSGFSTPVIFTLPNLLSQQRSYVAPTATSTRTVDHLSRVADINADGLVDLILHDGFPPKSGQSAGVPYQSGKAWVFLGTGNGFVQAPVSGSLAGFDRLVAVGDFDGDGLADIALEGQANVSTGSFVGSNPIHPTYVKQDGRIMFGNGGLPNRMTSLRSITGGVTTITYAPSSDFGTNQMPGVQQVVRSITENDGRGATTTTTFRYVGGAYDFVNRRTLGYRTVTASLPAISGETVGPEVVTTYLNGHIAEYGNVKSRVVTHAGVTQSSEILDYTNIIAGNGPYRTNVSSHRTATNHGGILIETREQFFYTPVYGQLSYKVDYGFTSVGANISTTDDVTTSYSYFPSLTAFIIDRPAFKWRQRGAASSTASTATWLDADFFWYDSNTTHAAAPTRGNLKMVATWIGDSTISVRHNMRRFTHDARGNVTLEADAMGNATTHTYDPAKGLFRLSSTNAAGHVVQTAWNNGCQVPLSQTDANGLVTTLTYDVFCREVRRNFPNGQYSATRYINFGSPVTQYVERESKSASSVPGRTLQFQREYFDGLGRIYKTTSSGTTSAIEDSIVQLRAYDARSNLAWQSIPLTWAAGTANTASAASRTTYSYDPLNRPILELYADSTYTITKYEAAAFTSSSGANVLHPGINTEPFNCHDGTLATACEEVVKFTDARGNLVRQTMFDVAGTDVGSLTSPERITNYGYDVLNRLTSIVDPVGATWAYTYNAFGHRTSASDPGLGLWSMTYDYNGDLLTQTDAKGQVISFSYDALRRPRVKAVDDGSTRVETRNVYDMVRSGYHNIGKQTWQEVWIGDRRDTIVRRDYHSTGAVEVEQHNIDGQWYAIRNSFAPNGSILNQELPNTPNSPVRAWVGAFNYDAANRITGIAGHITGVTYNLRSQPSRTDFGNGTWEVSSYNPARGWLNAVDGYMPGANPLFRAAYIRSATGRISQYDTGSILNDAGGSYNYTYDYAGRMLTAVNFRSAPVFNQVLSYDAGGRIRTKGPTAAATTSYQYSGTGPDHAPSSVSTAGSATSFTYDANGNMLTGLGGKVMTYDGENRPLSVTFNNKRTCYVYGADGSRLKKVENLPANQNCAILPPNAATTVYFGPVEIRHWQVPGQEQVITYPHPNVKLTNGVPSYLHRDHLGSVRAITDATGAKIESAVYKPFGEQTETLSPANLTPESKGWIGERYDADAGLQYLNARYYDPVLGLFLQPDWFEVLKPGVGTNRFSYSFNDPVNKLDPGGNGAVREFFEAIGRALRSSGDSAARGTINSVEAARARGVADAWRMEQQLVQRGLPTTRKWNDTELEILRNGGIPKDYVGDHITSVGADLTRAADHRNIQFLTVAEHTARHASHGGTRVPIFEDRIIDRTLGGQLPDLATEGARSWPQRAANAIDKVLNSHTFAVIDSVDPISIGDRAAQSMGYRGLFESENDYFLRYCASNSNNCL